MHSKTHNSAENDAESQDAYKFLLLSDILQSELTTEELNDQLPAPRCVHCNYRFNNLFETVLSSEKAPYQFFEKEDNLNYCDKMSILNDYSVYEKYIELKKKLKDNNEKR